MYSLKAVKIIFPFTSLSQTKAYRTEEGKRNNPRVHQCRLLSYIHFTSPQKGVPVTSRLAVATTKDGHWVSVSCVNWGIVTLKLGLHPKLRAIGTNAPAFPAAHSVRVASWCLYKFRFTDACDDRLANPLGDKTELVCFLKSLNHTVAACFI